MHWQPYFLTSFDQLQNFPFLMNFASVQPLKESFTAPIDLFLQKNEQKL